MVIIWRGYGWLVPVIVFAALIVTQLSLNAIYGDGFYKSHGWTKLAAGILGGIVIGLLGYYFNYKKRKLVINQETGKTLKSRSHSFFFIPVEYWAIIVPLLSFWIQNYIAEKDAREMALIVSPAVNDLYLADFTKIFKSADDKYKYGILKVSGISENDIEVIISDNVYNKQSGPKQDWSKGKTNQDSYFSKNKAVFKKDELVQLLKSDVIYSIMR